MLKIKSIKPMHTKLAVTAERYEENATSSGLILKTAGSVKEYQKVIAVGDMVRGIKVGDLVMINPARYMKKQFDDNSLREDFVENPVVSVNIPTVEMDGVSYFIIDSGTDVDYIIDDYEEVPEAPKSTIIQPKPVTFETPKIIV